MKLSDYEILYDLPAGEYAGKLIEGIRTVTIRAGKSLEVMCHPIVKPVPEGAKREAKARRTSAAMMKLNARYLELNVLRLIEGNFTEAAMVFTGTYEYPGENDLGMLNRDDLWALWEERRLPEAVSDVRRDVRNFLGRVRRRMKNPRGLKWILRIEEGAKELPLGLPPKYHIHMILEAEGLDRGEIEALWPFGYVQCTRFDVKRDGAARLASYLTKNKRCGRWVSHSRNLKRPEAKVSDRRMSRRRARRVAEDVLYAGREIFEKLYPGYRLMATPRVTYSDFMPGCYIYCRMRRDE